MPAAKTRCARPDGSGPEILDVTLGDMLDRQAEAHGDRPAVTVDELAGARITSWTYAELKAEADGIARGLMTLGIERGDHVAVMAQNCAEWILMEYALAKTGAVLVTVNPALLQGELEYLLTQSRAKALVFAPLFRSNDIAAHLTALMPDLAGMTGGRRAGGSTLPDLETLIAVGDAPGFAMPFADLRTLAEDTSAAALAERQARVDSKSVTQIQ